VCFEGALDDAVGRLYRVTELIAQAQLRAQYGLRADNLDLDDTQIPAASRERLAALADEATGRVRIGLAATYQLLAEMQDPLGQYFREHPTLIVLLQVRNDSLFAHGLEPIGAGCWPEVGPRWEAWLDGAIATLSADRPAGAPGEGPP
jgi:hypothetical protein